MSTLAKKQTNRQKAICGFTLQWKSNKNSSRRTVATSNLMHGARKETPAKDTKKAARATKKEVKIGSMFEIKACEDKSISEQEARGTKFGPSPNLEVHTTDLAGVHWVNQKDGVFSVMVIPRERTLQRINQKNTALVVLALDKLQHMEKDCKRSNSKTGKSTSNSRYTIFGNKIHRGGHGFVHDRLSALDHQAANTLRKWAGRMEHLTAEFIPSQWLRAISKANGFSAWPTLFKTKFVAAMASSVNYSAPAHVDDDFLFSIHQVNVEGCLQWDDVVQCFCFPTYGFAIGLRPGDVILFNPHVYHCLSEKSEVYCSKDVHVTTFYVKTAHVGKNNNTVPLTEEEELYYNMNFT
jgi:hypothetical protein